VDAFYGKEGSMFVEAYDAFYGSAPPPQVAGDAAFYERLARQTGGPALELGCGTGRIALALAEAGLPVTGVDLSEGMLTIARRKLAQLPLSVQERLTLINQDMTTLELGRRFGCVLVPFRSFQHLLTTDLQRKCLAATARHLEPSGRLALHLFDPRLDMLIAAGTKPAGLSGTRSDTGRRYLGEVLHTDFDHLNQVRRDLWRYSEIGADGEALGQETRRMALRWTYRWELYHLLSLCGLSVEAEYSDFGGAAPAYGKELIVIARLA
jgi:SAM-dependent methyltransferase